MLGFSRQATALCSRQHPLNRITLLVAVLQRVMISFGVFVCPQTLPGHNRLDSSNAIDYAFPSPIRHQHMSNQRRDADTWKNLI